MPGYNQISYLKNHVDYIIEPIAIIGSKEYSFDKYNFINLLNELGLKDITGIDIQEGDGVDKVLDICNTSDNYFKLKSKYFNTIICMQTLYSVKNPFKAAKNIYHLMNENAVLLFSDVFTHRIHRIPNDNWRFTYDAHKILFDKLEFDDSRVKIGITRGETLINYKYPFPELLKYKKQKNESILGYILRKINRKLFLSGLLDLPILLPELSIFSFAKNTLKKKHNEKQK
tara:strand:- start:800 stop:1486 length:687 start_codon:yes stop_codon:yes gene_type:complete